MVFSRKVVSAIQEGLVVKIGWYGLFMKYIVVESIYECTPNDDTCTLHIQGILRSRGFRRLMVLLLLPFPALLNFVALLMPVLIFKIL